MNYNPFLPEVKENPYPYYAYLRRHAPAYQIEGIGWWAITRYDDVLSILRNPETFSSAIMMVAVMGEFNFAPEAIIGMDPPAHTRLRKLVNRAFTPRLVASLESRIREITKDLIAPMRATGEFDLMAGLANPLPVMVIAEMLGVEPARWDDFKEWTNAIVLAMGGRVAEDQRGYVSQCISDLQAYIRNMITERRKEPRNDLITALIRAEEENQVLTSEEVFNLAIFVLAAGSETTTNLIGNGVLALLAHPAELAKVQENPALLPNMVEEILRHSGPVQTLSRQTTRAVELSGTAIPAGAVLLPLYASANRDERKFPDPDRFDITRNAEGHLGFGYGIHFCLGAPLARLEARVVFEELLFHCPPFSRTDAPVVRGEGVMIHGPKTLPLRFEAR